MDAAARWVIRLGGMGVTLAFAAIVVFLALTVIPLLQPPEVRPVVAMELPVNGAGTRPATQPARMLSMGVDEFISSVWLLDDAGVLSVYRTAGGELVRREKIVDKPITAFSEMHGVVAFGHPDGTVRTGRIKDEITFLSAQEIPDAAESLAQNQTLAYDGKVGQMTPSGQLRTLKVVAQMSDPIKIGEAGSPIRLVDFQRDDSGDRVSEKLAVVLEDGRVVLSTVNRVLNRVTRRWVTRNETFNLPRSTRAAGRTPVALQLGQSGEQLYLIHNDGWTVLYNTREASKTTIAEELDVLEAPELRVAAVEMLLGDFTLIVTDSAGGVTGWFPASSKGGAEKLVRAHDLLQQSAPVTSIGISQRDRQFLTADGKGHVVLRHMTSNTTQYDLLLAGSPGVVLARLAPKNDGIVALEAQGRLTVHSLNNPHADASMAQLFLPLHYEGYDRPQFVYQSSAGHQSAEPKMSLVPLIWGTLKGTLYAMLFAVPLAVSAAIYTSEFMTPKVRAAVKPTIELMASLPSVVLGYIGAQLIATWVEDTLMGVLVTLLSIPLGVLMAGFLWQMLPPRRAAAVPEWVRFLAMSFMIVLAALLAIYIGPFVETVFFAGDFKSWLTGGVGSATPGWALLLTPVFGVALSFVFNVYIKQRLPIYHRADVSRLVVGLLEWARFAGLAAASIGLAFAVGAMLSAMHWDIRGPLVGPYVKLNALMVGIVMGFAIIPIIYTVSEDALSSVPGSLRSASLGAGATPWQTAIRVVLPVATSGIFSACMIGFGRAAGETLVVLMLSGRTTIIDFNPFNGFSPLSANIATELPEAPVGSSHYRVLFLSALVLFAMTFVVNTVAEVVRLRFRKRAYQL